MLKQDLEKQIRELQSQFEFSKDLLEKKIDLPKSITQKNNE